MVDLIGWHQKDDVAPFMVMRGEGFWYINKELINYEQLWRTRISKQKGWNWIFCHRLTFWTYSDFQVWIVWILRKSSVSASAKFTPNTYTPWSDAQVPESSYASLKSCSLLQMHYGASNTISVLAFGHFYFELLADYCSQGQCLRFLWA